MRKLDFIIKKGRKITTFDSILFLIYPITKPKKEKQKALIRASKELDCPHLLIITANHEGEEIIKDKKIKYIPAWKWLLDTE